MKKENIVSKILLKSIIGFSMGITLLVLSYASVYFISGETVFIAELYQLHNINIFISQFISAGIAGYILFIFFYIIFILQYKQLENLKLKAQHPYKFVFSEILLYISIILIILPILGNKKIFSENIIVLNISLLVLTYVLIALIFSIKVTKESILIKKINNLIQKRNK